MYKTFICTICIYSLHVIPFDRFSSTFCNPLDTFVGHKNPIKSLPFGGTPPPQMLVFGPKGVFFMSPFLYSSVDVTFVLLDITVRSKFALIQMGWTSTNVSLTSACWFHFCSRACLEYFIDDWINCNFWIVRPLEATTYWHILIEQASSLLILGPMSPGISQ